MSDWSKRLDGIKADCQIENWDSYHASPVTDKALDVARAVCESFWQSPTNRGGIQLSWANESIQFDIDSEGRISVVYADLDEFDKWVTLRLGRVGDHAD